MKSRRKPMSDKVEQQMTPMIDIVFQLLTFFVMSFKIATQEGDFNIKMPIGLSASQNNSEVQPIKVRMIAAKGGSLAEIRIGDRGLGTSFQALQSEIAAMAGADLEVEFDCDYNLHYNNVMNAITAVSGRRQGEKIIKYVDKIKFSPPRVPQG
ncbi:MAG TPA: biopolymer transporter ExbD [Pirellulales bacterium]|jgi:biopolymer transport protein ExbD|nr:biopolymer transporter ExbD [Pirellulales bacterium]